MELPEALLEFMKTAPYVAIIIWYTLTLRRQEKEERAERDKTCQEFLTQQTGGTLRALDAVALGMKDITECIRTIDARTILIHNIIDDHDRHAQGLDKSVAVLAERYVHSLGKKEAAGE